MARPSAWLTTWALVVTVNATGGTKSWAQEGCTAADRVQACSLQCCGRKACTPACEIDCVKVCVDACGSTASQTAFGRDLNSMRIRCGYQASGAKPAQQ